MIPKPPKRKSKGAAMRAADLVYSYYRRQSLADESGILICISCGKRFYWTAVDLGHFIGRSYHATRFYEPNTHGQCRIDNAAQCGKKTRGFGWRGKPLYGRTVLAKHKRSLIELYGPDIIDHLNAKSQEIQKDSREWYAEVEARFRGIIRAEGWVEP